MMFRGREIAFTDIGRNLMERIKFELINEGIIDQEPRLEGRNMVMIVSPKNNKDRGDCMPKLKTQQRSG